MDVLFLEKRLDIDYLLTFEFDQMKKENGQKHKKKTEGERNFKVGLE